MLKAWIAVMAFVLAGSGPCAKPAATPKPGDPVTIHGKLTGEGVECPAMRDAAGTLYTLSGSLGAFKAGDEVCVKGRVAEVSTCMQGVTLTVEWIKPRSECP